MEKYIEQKNNIIELRSRIDEIESVMMRMEDRKINITPKHYFANGLYAREIFIPKGTTLTGKIHKFEHINIISKGDIEVMTENGIERIVAPATIISKPGTKRIGYAHEDTVWTTFHATDETDENKIEDALVVCSYEEYLEFEKEQKLLEDKICHS